MEFDVWSDTDGKLTATQVKQCFVSDLDAPYGFSRHEIRVVAKTARAAIAAYRAAR